VRANHLFEVGLIRAEPISLSTDRREVRAAGTLDHAPIVEPGLVRRNSGLPSPPDECEIGGRTAARNDECQDGPHKRRTGQRTAAWRDAARVVFLFDLALPHRGNVFAGQWGVYSKWFSNAGDRRLRRRHALRDRPSWCWCVPAYSRRIQSAHSCRRRRRPRPEREGRLWPPIEFVWHTSVSRLAAPPRVPRVRTAYFGHGR